jgi:catechol 2,3-dioxygenase-like lactoylglutathione lyase family enzyme
MTRPQRTVLVEGAAAGTLRMTSVSHIAFGVPDATAAADFYERVLGLQVHSTSNDGTLRLGWGSGHHVLDLVPGEKKLLHYAFEVRDAGGLDGIRQRLSAAAISFDPLDPDFVDEAAGVVDGIVVRDPDGTAVHFHSPVRRAGEHSADTGRRPVKFQHTTIGTADVMRFVDFFVGTVGFRISDQLQNGRFCWMRSDRDHHTLAVVDVGRGGDIDHYSYDLAEWEDFKTWCDRLTDLDVPVQWGPGRHGPGNNLFVFFDDPAGNHVELSAEMEKFHDDRAEYTPRQWEPRPETVNLWGGQTPTWRTVGSEARS